jgi:hypothetical protein
LVAFFADLKAVLVQVKRVLRPGGHTVMVIADNTVGGERVEAHRALISLAKELGLIEIHSSEREIDVVRRRFPVGQFGFDGPMTHEHIVVLRKPITRRLRPRT